MFCEKFGDGVGEFVGVEVGELRRRDLGKYAAHSIMLESLTHGGMAGHHFNFTANSFRERQGEEIARWL